MAITKVSDLSNSAVTNYQKKYYLVSAERKEVFGQFVDWQDAIPDDGGYSTSYDWPAYGELDPVESALTEDADVTPDAIDDYNITLTPAEYGRAVASTQLLRFNSRTRLQNLMGDIVAKDRVNSIDRIIRRTVVGRGSSYPTQTLHVDSSVAMSSLTSTDTVTWAFLNELGMHARASGMEPFDGSNFVAVVHPLLMYDLKNLTEFKSVGYYQVPDHIYRGEVGQLGGVRLVESHQARVYLGAGTAVQAATTLSAAAVKGATAIAVTSATGLTVGNYITIGTLETESVNPGDNLEQVLITAVSGTDLTIRAAGDGTGFGLRFDHASGESVVEAYNVCPLPILGRGSIIGCYAQRTGRYGQAITKKGLDLLDRFIYHGWYWYGGFARVEKHLILGKVAVSKSFIGYN